MQALQQLRYLLYRNFLLKRRNIKQTAYEVISVLYLVGILAVIRLTSVKPTTKPAVRDAQIPTFNLRSPNYVAWPPKEIGYVYAQNANRSVVEPIVSRLSQSLPTARFVSFQTVDDLEDGHKQSPRNLSLGVVFDTTKGNTQIEYTIKAPYDAVTDPAKKFVGNEEDKCRTPTPQYFMLQYNKVECPAHSYYASGFSVLQAYIEAAAIEVVSGQSGYLPFNVSIKMAPKDKFLTPISYLKTLVSIYMVIAFSPYIMFLLTFIVSEKEKKIKEAMKIMGLNMYVFWLGWFITYAVVISIGVLLVTIIAHATKLFGDSDFLVILIILLLYALSIETLAFMLTPLFTKAKTAGTVGSIITIIFSPLSLLHVYLNTSNSVKWLTCLLSPVALSLSLTPALEHGEGLSWKNVGTKGEFPAAYGMLMLIIDIILYLIIAIYLDAVFPGEYGIRRHPLFFINPSFWKSFSKKQKTRTPSLMRSSSVKSEEPYADIEDVPIEFQDKKVISIRKIAKIFKPNGKDAVRAVDGISLDVYEGQITALLGHNGAGKSTLIALLTGLLPISSGKAIIYGFNIVTSDGLDKLREILGLCPQQNIIFDELTPQEHLKIYAGIKGIDPKEIQALVDETLQDVDLLDQKDTISKSLSGGQKRKLCVGIALIGDPKVVILDEPTSGMDPASRRKIWSLLQRKREGRVIFLTTHFMDEADILADYKAIISKGKLRCAGSSLFLKNRFGVGYHLRMVIDPSCERNTIVDLVTENVPGAQLSREHSKELAFQLPLSSVDKFTDLFASLENHNSTGEPCSAADLGVKSYGVSMTTLEEVFLKLDDLETDVDTAAPNQREVNESDRGTNFMCLTASEPGKSEKRIREHLYNESADLQAPEMVLRRNHLYSFAWQQFWALMEIRFWTTIRNKVKIFFQVVVPPIFIIVGLVLLNKQKPQQASSSKILHMQPSLYLAEPGGKSLPNFLVKNSTIGDLEGFIQAISHEGIAYDVVKNLSNLLDMQPHNLAVDVDALPSKETLKYLLRYNDSAIHSIPVGINFVSNILLRRALATSGKSYSGEGEPLSLTSVSFKPIKPPWVYDYSSYVSVLLISMCFCLMPSGFAIQVVHYREAGVRHQLRVSGAGRLVYWMHFLIGDMTLYLFPVALVYILIAAFDINGLNSSPALGTLGLLLILYIPTSLLFAYILSFPFNKWETVQNVFGTVFIFLGIIPYSTVSTIDMVSGDIKGSTVAHALHVVFLLLDPPYAIFGGLYYITRVFRVQSILSQSNDVHIPSSKYFELELENGIPAALIVLTVQLVFFSWLVYCLDCWKTGGVAVFPFSLCSRKRHQWNNRQCGSMDETAEELNEDVQLERERVCKTYLDNKAGEKAVLVQGLSKSFGKKKVVNDVSFCVDRGEIMGLLGPNGAGKTTTLNMVTADFQPTTGMIHVGGYNTKSDLNTAFQSLGYCPQFGGLFELCTVKEHLRCYALIKGISKDNVDSIVNHFMSALKITEHANKKEKELSGGTKRKLSFLISMMGNPSIVMLDEPSTGMDPAARRFLWTAISRNIGEDRGAILTTHSMEEADALCSRVGIIVKGNLRCIGTTQELKTNYGGGYQLEVKGRKGTNEDIEEAVEGTKRFVEGIFPSAVLAESFGTRMTFKVPKDGIQNLSSVFRKLEEGKSTVNIEEYSFSQSSLEQVFLEFAKEQDDDLTGGTEMKSPVESKFTGPSMA